MLVEQVEMIERLIWVQKKEQEEEYRIEDQVEMIESLIQVVWIAVGSESLMDNRASSAEAFAS